MSDLKKVYLASGPGDAHVLRGLLEAEGIQVLIRGDDFVPLQGGSLFHLETRPSVWVLEDEYFARAQEIARDYAERVERNSESGEVSETGWTCSSCGELIENQFTDCWKCGSSRV